MDEPTTTLPPPSTTVVEEVPDGPTAFIPTSDGPIRDFEAGVLLCLLLILVAVWILVGRTMSSGRSV